MNNINNKLFKLFLKDYILMLILKISINKRNNILLTFHNILIFL